MPHTNGNSNNNEAKQCAQICEEVALEFSEWIADHDFKPIQAMLRMGKNMYYNVHSGDQYTTKELFTLFINQKQEP